MNKKNQLPQSDTVLNFLESLSTLYKDRPALFGRIPSSDGDIDYSLTYKQLYEYSKKLAHKMSLLNLQKNDRVLVYAKSCPEFSVGFFAVPLAGGVVVPLDIRLTLEDQKYIAEFSEAKFILCMDSESALACEQLKSQVEQPLQIINIGDGLKESSPSEKKFELAHSLQAASDVMVVTFTSGTTSKPKGVMLSWDNLAYQLRTLLPSFQERSNFELLSILPLHHMFEITAGLLLPLYQGGTVHYANTMIPHQIISLMNRKKIRDILAVPLFLTAIKKGIVSEVQTSRAKRIWFDVTYSIARFVPFKAVRKLMFLPLHIKFGGQLRRFISGASALDPRVARFFETIGISVYEGYGMTETSPVISCSSPAHSKSGSIGKPIAGTEVKLHPNTQELLVRGPGVMLGYLKNPDATAACLSEDGWLNTGDVVEIDQDGFLFVRGRNKDVIVLSNGKKVVPEEVENCFRDISDFSDICALGVESVEGLNRGSEVVTLVVVPSPTCTSTENEIEDLLRKTSMTLSYYKRPSNFIVFREALPKTSTMKIKKNLVKELILTKRTMV